MLNQDYKEMLQYLQEEGAEFLIVGAYAMAAHGFPRSTADFDIWVNPAKKNAMRVFRALAKFGAPMQGVSPADFEKPDTVFQIGVAPCRIDIITTISGNIDFDEAFSRAEHHTFKDICLPILSIDDLIHNKMAAGRSKDLEDVKFLKKNLE
ncbi:MAG: nucleotidyltransferase [Desulfobacterales bacterium]